MFGEVANRDYPSTLNLSSDEVDLTFAVPARLGRYLVPQMRSCRAVSPADWNFTSCPSRNVRTSASSAD